MKRLSGQGWHGTRVQSQITDVMRKTRESNNLSDQRNLGCQIMGLTEKLRRQIMPLLIKETFHLSFPQACPVSWSGSSSSTWNWWTWFLLQNALYFPFCHLSICCLTRHWRERRCPENQTCSAALSSLDYKYALIHSKSYDYKYTNIPRYINTIYKTSGQIHVHVMVKFWSWYFSLGSYKSLWGGHIEKT